MMFKDILGYVTGGIVRDLRKENRYLREEHQKHLRGFLKKTDDVLVGARKQDDEYRKLQQENRDLRNKLKGLEHLFKGIEVKEKNTLKLLEGMRDVSTENKRLIDKSQTLLSDIAAQETKAANATVKRMAKMARNGMAKQEN